MREKAAVTTLRYRRIEASDKFAAKCLGNTRFSHWFPRKQIRSGMRGGEQYLEEHARCNRLRDFPIFFMRRRLNGKEGKSYGKTNAEYCDTEGAGTTQAKRSTRMNPARNKKT